MHIKIDELIRVTQKARNVLLDLEELDEQTLEELRTDYEKLAREAKSRTRTLKRFHRSQRRPRKDAIKTPNSALCAGWIGVRQCAP
jgi:low affinity Fe/Cu permease